MLFADDMGSVLNKREGLIAFPRIGRSEGGADRGEANADKGGLWFGPRLGRRDKRAMLLPPWGAVLSLKGNQKGSGDRPLWKIFDQRRLASKYNHSQVNQINSISPAICNKGKVLKAN